MTTVNMLDAKTNLSRLVEALESGQEQEIIIARNGKPAARLVLIAKPSPVEKRIGVAKGLFDTPDPDPELDAEIAALFLGKEHGDGA
jgi:antitoxin (DNA-binding transcriptional repressor) of toxin-antitoxin stability system